jgi:hypothetical protein
MSGGRRPGGGRKPKNYDPNTWALHDMERRAKELRRRIGSGIDPESSWKELLGIDAKLLEYQLAKQASIKSDAAAVRAKRPEEMTDEEINSRIAELIGAGERQEREIVAPLLRDWEKSPLPWKYCWACSSKVPIERELKPVEHADQLRRSGVDPDEPRYDDPRQASDEPVINIQDIGDPNASRH